MLKKILIAYAIFFSTSTCAHAYSIAVKLDLLSHDKNVIYHLVQHANYSAKESKKLIPKASYHVTIGYIDINTLAQAKVVANDIKSFLTKIINQNNYFLSVTRVINFGNYTVLNFDPMTKIALKRLNFQLDAYVKQLSIQKKIKFSLNKLTQPNQYTPHLTIKKQISTQVALQRLDKAINSLKAQNKKLMFKVFAINYSIV